MIDDFSPIMQGDTGNPFNVQIRYTANGKPYPLDNVTFSMKMQIIETIGDIGKVGMVKTCSVSGDGAVIVDDAENGKCHRQWQPEDVDIPGKWGIYLKAIRAGRSVTGDNGFGHPKTITILPAP
jgi:hypothetical protein